MAQITADRLHVKIGSRKILRDICFSIEAGAWIGLIGPNGSGKTTLLRTISGLQSYTGSLKVNGRAVSDWRVREMAQQLAFVRQVTPLSFDFTVRDIVLLGRSPHKGYWDRTTRNDRKLVQRALEWVDMGAFSTRSMLSLSGGERQRVFLAQALVQEAELLLLDEPTTHLDVHHQYGFLDLVHSFVKQGSTVVAVFHELELAARYADHLFVLEDGRLVATGTPQEVLTESLLASIFRIKGYVQRSSNGHLRIYVQQPTA